ncbi:MAG TPA: DUF4175 family protein [Planctomycetaceae bacterium]|nr:DUF4175 family protein [Planctomycetaceae bacterium]
MTQVIDRQAPFVRRFALLSRRQRQLQFGRIVARASLLAVCGFALLMGLDFAWELPREIRGSLLIVVIAATVGYAGVVLAMTIRRWSQAATATEIEQAFPELGQCVRTTVEFSTLSADEVQAAGVTPSLVQALTQQTHERALPLTIEDVIPLGSLKLAAGGLLACLVLIAVAVNADWQLRAAFERALLVERPYRTLSVNPGDQIVDEGGEMDVRVALKGRTDRLVALQIRQIGNEDPTWIDRELQALAPPAGSSTVSAAGFGSVAGSPSPPQIEFSSHFSRLSQPLEYRVVTGELASPIYRIDIRRPLRIGESTVTLTPPAYTGQLSTKERDLNLTALEGTVARFELVFDKAVKSAALVLLPRRPLSNEAPDEPEILPLSLAQVDASPQSAASAAHKSPRSQLVTRAAIELALNEDRYYTIRAEAEDGTSLRETKYRIRVREDQPPLVGFQEPRDAVEVHSLAEILLQIRVSDDYGLAQAGIVFQINNEEEVSLVAQDFATVAQADAEVQTTGKVTPTTRTMLEKLLPLELFELTQKDSVMYYAFAVDNRPDRPQRTETDLQYIDIRPFKRTYQVVDPDPMPGGGGGGFRSLEELIRRQRFAVNRTQKIERHAAVGRPPSAEALAELMAFETDLADSTRESAQGLEARGFDDTDLFYQAEAAMRQAVDSLSVGKWENASLQMRDALKALIEQRDRIQLFILKNPDPALLAQLRQFDRMQSQKLRRPKTDREEAREIIGRLEQLATEESSVVKNLESPDARSEAPASPE